MRDEWTQDEIDVSVAAYLDMLSDEVAGKPYNKAAMNRELREGALSSRSRGSIEMRMCNISAVLEDSGARFINGYKPRRNVGASVHEMIADAVRRHSGTAGSGVRIAGEQEPPASALEYTQPTADPEELDRRVSLIRANEPLGDPPSGNQSPSKVVTPAVVQHERDPRVKRWVLDNAAGKCELCKQPGPFQTAGEGNPHYLEVHHVRPLAEGGPDTCTNAVAICPNCHRRCHYSIDAEACTESLYLLVDRLIR